MSEPSEQLGTPVWVTPILAEFEGVGYFDETELTGRIGRAIRENEAAPAPERKAAFAEFSAFGFRPLDLGGKSRWGTHFAEHFSMGGVLEPNISNVDAAVLAYWQVRMGQAGHPILKARYADLLWDLSKAAGASRSPVDAAREAADSYVAIGPLAIEVGAMIRAGDQLARGLQIAVQIKDDTGRVERARDAFFALYERMDHTAGWMALSGILGQLPKVPVTPAQRERIAERLERHIDDVASRPDGAQPSETLHVAFRLANYYRMESREEDARRVIRASGQAVERAAASASSAALAHAWLEMTYGFFRDAGLKDDAQRVLLACRVKGEQAQGEMVTSTVTYQFSEEESAALQRCRQRVIGGTLEQAWFEIVVGFTPHVSRLRELLAERVRSSPIFSIFGTSQMREGQTVGRAGPMSADPDGALVTFLAEYISLDAGQLGWFIDSIRVKFDVTAERLVDYLYESLVFATEFRSLIAQDPNHPRAEGALAAGVWRLVAQPVDLPAVLALIDEALGQPLVLVVDDDDDLCLNLWDVLHERNYRVGLAHDTASAAACLRDKHFRVILLDLKLPDGDGAALVYTARQADPQAQVVVITGYRAELGQRAAQLLAAGAHTLLAKPFDVANLLTTLEQLTGASAARH